MHSPPGDVKQYYVAGESYDWVTDPRALERLFHRSRAKVVARILRHSGNPSVAIDVGCGTGLITRSIHARIVVGMDINLWNLRRAKSRLSDADFVRCDCDHIPLREEVADLTVTTEVLEHLEAPGQTLEEIARVSRSNGRFVGSVPSKSPLWKFRDILSVTHPKSEPFHNNFSRREFQSLVAATFVRTRVFHDNFFMTVFCVADIPRRFEPKT